LIVAVRNLRAELKVEQKQRVPIQFFTEEAEIRSLFAQNRGAIERLANVEGVTFVESSLSKLSGARHTARFDVHVVYERKVDVVAERERLKRNWNRSKGNWQWAASTEQRAISGQGAGQSSRGHARTGAELSVLREKTQSKLDELGA